MFVGKGASCMFFREIRIFFCGSVYKVFFAGLLQMSSKGVASIVAFLTKLMSASSFQGNLEQKSSHNFPYVFFSFESASLIFGDFPVFQTMFFLLGDHLEPWASRRAMHLEAPMWIGVVVGLQCIEVCRWVCRLLDGGFLKWWYPTTMGFPTKNDHFGVVLGVPPS